MAKTYKTPDIYLAAYLLSRGLNLAKTTQTNTFIYFHFQTTTEMFGHYVQEFTKDVKLQHYLQQHRLVRTLIKTSRK